MKKNSRVIGVKNSSVPVQDIQMFRDEDVIVFNGPDEQFLSGLAMGAKLSQLYIIDVLFQEYYRRNKEISIENNRKTSKAVVDKLY